MHTTDKMSDVTDANDAPLIIYDTLSGQKRPLETLQPGKCTVYCCGPTVYDMSHIGHALAASMPDLLVRFLRHQGLEVTYARNITDVDDQIIKRAAENGLSCDAIAERYTAEYQSDLRALGLLEPDVQPKVTEHIAEILELIESLLAGDMAYVADGDVYFRVTAFPAYGCLSKRKLDDMQAGARVEVDARKQHPMDFALWKAAKPGEPSWDSPWGPGRPGWHIECSAMSTKQLGASFDIHTGGRDLIFPHHENEIAQYQGAHGERSYARYWMHNGFVNFGGEKMSKSLGNFFTIREVTKLYHPEVLRYFLISVHYRSSLNFDVEVLCPSCNAAMDREAQQQAICAACGYNSSAEELRSYVRFPGLEEADERLAYIYETLRNARAFVTTSKAPSAPPAKGGKGKAGTGLPASIEHMVANVVEAMRDDLNTAAAIAALSEPLSEVNRLLASKKGVSKDVRWRSIDHFSTAMTTVGSILGVFEHNPEEYLLARRDLKAARIHLDVAKVQVLIDERAQARKDKAWERADEIRQELESMGVSVRDGTDGSTWAL